MFVIILIGKRELDALHSLSSWCLGMAGWLSLAVPWGCLWFVIVVFLDDTHLIFLSVAVHIIALLHVGLINVVYLMTCAFIRS